MATATTKKKMTKKAAPAPTAESAVPMQAPLFNAFGKQVEHVSLPPEIFALPWNPDLVHQVVTSMQANARRPWAHTKTRGEVRGGGKKPWKQKGTGRARHGSSRSPIWVGGGVAHGPRKDKSYAKSTTQKMRQKALLTVLSRKWKDGEVIFVDKFQMQEPKTATARALLRALETAGCQALGKSRNAALVVMPENSRPVAKSFSNFGNIDTTTVGNLNPVAALSAKYLVVIEPETAFSVLSKKQVVRKK